MMMMCCRDPLLVSMRDESVAHRYSALVVGGGLL
jgi:hypothetical protein